MSTIRAVLIDDEQQAHTSLVWELEHSGHEVEILGAFTDPKAAIEAVPKLKPDLVFLDVQMPEMDGFQVLKQLDTSSLEVVFVTAFDQYAVSAFRHSAFDYLLKPVDGTALKACLDRFVERGKVPTSTDQMDFLFSRLQGGKQSIGKVALPHNTGLMFVHVDSIVHCESASNYTTVYFADGTDHVICKTLKDIQQLLDGYGFYRIHNSHLINLRNVEEYRKSDGGYVVMDNGAHITVSRSKREEIIKLFS